MLKQFWFSSLYPATSIFQIKNFRGLPVFGYGSFGHLCVTLPIRVRSRTNACCGRDRVIYESYCCSLAKEGESSAKIHADRRARLRNNVAVRQRALTRMRRCQWNAALGRRQDQRQVESARRLSDHTRAARGCSRYACRPPSFPAAPPQSPE